MKPSIVFRGVCGCLMLFASGCTAAMEGEPASEGVGEPGESTATSSEELVGCGCGASSVKWYTSTHFSGVKVGPAQNDYICWAGEYGGMDPFDTPNNYPYLSVYTNNVNWIVAGTGKMACVKRCCFYSNHPSQDEILVSDGFQVQSYAAIGKSNVTAVTDMWLSDSMALPQGMYHFGGNPRDATAKVNQNFNPYSTTLVATASASSTKSSTTIAYGRSFFVGIPHGNPPHVVKQKSFGFSGTPSVLIPGASGICVPSYVRDMDPYDDVTDYLSVWVGADGMWRAESTFRDGFSRALEATCFYYDQSN